MQISEIPSELLMKILEYAITTAESALQLAYVSKQWYTYVFGSVEKEILFGKKMNSMQLQIKFGRKFVSILGKK